MKVLLINGSPRANGNTARALKEVADTLAAEGIETETVWIGKKQVRGCVACYQCVQKSLGHCVFDDDIANRIIEITDSGVIDRVCSYDEYMHISELEQQVRG